MRSGLLIWVKQNAHNLNLLPGVTGVEDGSGVLQKEVLSEQGKGRGSFLLHAASPFWSGLQIVSVSAASQAAEGTEALVARCTELLT